MAYQNPGRLEEISEESAETVIVADIESISADACRFLRKSR